MLLETQKEIRSQPIFFHMPSGGKRAGITREVRQEFRKLSQLILNHKRTLRHGSPNNMTLVTYSNYSKPTLIEKCYHTYDIPHTVVSREVERWSWKAKIAPLLQYLESPQESAELVVATDANDILLVGDLMQLASRFEEYSCDMLFCNTHCNWPPQKNYAHFEKAAYPEWPFHCHLSAGGYVGRWHVVREYLREIVDGYTHKKHGFLYKGKFDDQAAWRFLHRRDYPRIQVDCRSRVFKRFDVYRHWLPD